MRILRVISISLILSMYCGALFAQSDLDRQNRRRRDAERRLEEIKGLIGSNTGDIRKSETALKLTRNGIEAKREIVASLDDDTRRRSTPPRVRHAGSTAPSPRSKKITASSSIRRGKTTKRTTRPRSCSPPATSTTPRGASPTSGVTTPPASAKGRR